MKKYIYLTFLLLAMLFLGVILGKALVVQETKTEIVYIDAPEIEFIEHPICSVNTFKSWMDYRKITAPSSDQYKLQSKSTTNQVTGIREYKGYLMVAMASIYGPVGRTYEITFESNQTINVIIGDIKADTDCEHSDGSMIEFIVDENMIRKNVINTGNFNEMFVGQIVKIKE